VFNKLKAKLKSIDKFADSYQGSDYLYQMQKSIDFFFVQKAQPLRGSFSLGILIYYNT